MEKVKKKVWIYLICLLLVGCQTEEMPISIQGEDVQPVTFSLPLRTQEIRVSHPTIRYEEIIPNNIEETAIRLNGTDVKTTVYKIDSLAVQYIEYEFTYYPKTIEQILKTKKGDCSDHATLSMHLLSLLGIKTRKVYGYILIDDQKYKHDWFEYYDQGEWKDIESEMYNIIKQGRGFW
jgi:transglutaminase-like putative cysteine protease